MGSSAERRQGRVWPNSVEYDRSVCALGSVFFPGRIAAVLVGIAVAVTWSAGYRFQMVACGAAWDDRLFLRSLCRVFREGTPVHQGHDCETRQLADRGFDVRHVPQQAFRETFSQLFHCLSMALRIKHRL